MADPTQSTPADSGVQWDAPATVQTGSSTPTPQATTPAAAPVTNSGIQWDDEQPVSSEPTLRQQLQANTEPLSTNTGHPLTNISNFGQDILRRGARVIGNGVLDTVDPVPDNQPAAQQIVDEMHKATDYAAPMHSVVDRAHEFGQEYKQDPGVAAANVVGDAGATAATARIAGGIGDLAGAAVDKFNAPKNLQKTAAHRGFTAVLDQGKAGMGKNFDAQDVANDIAPVVQQELRSNPTLRARILDPKATPKESYEAFQEAIQNAQGHIDEAHIDALKNVKNQPVDVKPILNEIDKLKTEGMGKYAPEDAEELDALQRRIASVDTLGELNGLRMYLNNQTSPSFKMSGVAVQRSAMLDKALNAAGSATRDTYYDGLSNSTGQDFKKLKQTESNLLSAREALENAKGPLVSKQIQFNRPTTVKQKVGATARAVTSLATGDKKEIANATLLESPMAQTHADIRRFTKELPTSGLGSYEGVQNPDRPRLSNRTTPETVTAQTTPNPRPSGPPAEVGNGGSQGQLPAGSNGTLARSRPGSVQTDNTGQLPSGPGNAPGLPQGHKPQGLPAAASNSRVGVPGEPYPSLNTSTAVDRTARPIYTKPGTIPDRNMSVTPQGDVVIKREALPAPAPKPKKPRTNQ